MRRLALMFALATMPLAANLHAAELDIPARRAVPENIPVQKGPPNCDRWTDECVTCSRGAESEAPACSNIGVACQPKETRCVSPTPAAK
jgi:hypothetical protein